MNCNRYKILFTAIFFTLFTTQTNIFGISDDDVKEIFKDKQKALKNLQNKIKNKKINLNWKSEKNQNTLLHYAAYFNNMKIIKYLIERNPSINAKNSNGETPLNYSIKKNLKISKKLLTNNKNNKKIYQKTLNETKKAKKIMDSIRKKEEKIEYGNDEIKKARHAIYILSGDIRSESNTKKIIKSAKNISLYAKKIEALRDLIKLDEKEIELIKKQNIYTQNKDSIDPGDITVTINDLKKKIQKCTKNIKKIQELKPNIEIIKTLVKNGAKVNEADIPKNLAKKNPDIYNYLIEQLSKAEQKKIKKHTQSSFSPSKKPNKMIEEIKEI